MSSHPTDQVLRRKLVIIGDGACGKTSLLSVFTLGYFPTHYIPTVFENYVTDCQVDGKSVQLALWDTAGQEDYERLRTLAYDKAHVILIAFAVDNIDSFENVEHKWSEETREHAQNVPIILVGLKGDLRKDAAAVQRMKEQGLKFVSPSKIEELRDKIRAKKYVECSAREGDNVDDVFEASTRAALAVGDSRRSNKCCCTLM